MDEDSGEIVTDDKVHADERKYLDGEGRCKTCQHSVAVHGEGMGMCYIEDCDCEEVNGPTIEEFLADKQRSDGAELQGDEGKGQS